MKKQIINLVFAFSLLLLYPSIQIVYLHYVSDELISKLSNISPIIDNDIMVLTSKDIYCTDYRDEYEDRNNNKSLDKNALTRREFGSFVDRIFWLPRNIDGFPEWSPDFSCYLISRADLAVTKNFKAISKLLDEYEEKIESVSSYRKICEQLCPQGDQTDELVEQDRKEEIFKDVFTVMREYQPQIKKHVDLQLAQQYKIKYLAYFLVFFETLGMIIVFHKFYIHVLGRLIRGEPIQWKDDL